MEEVEKRAHARWSGVVGGTIRSDFKVLFFFFFYIPDAADEGQQADDNCECENDGESLPHRYFVSVCKAAR